MRTFLCGVALLCASCGSDVTAEEVAELRGQVEALRAQVAPSAEAGGAESVGSLGNLARCLEEIGLGNLRTRAQAAELAVQLQRCGQFGTGELEGTGVRPEASAERISQCYEACGWFRPIRGTDERRRAVGGGHYYPRGSSMPYGCYRRAAPSSSRTRLWIRGTGTGPRMAAQCGSQLRADPENICGGCRDEAPNVQQNLGIDPPPGMETEGEEDDAPEAEE